MTRTIGAKDRKPRKVDPNRKPGSRSASVTANLNAKQEDISRIVMESVQYFKRPIVKSDEECADRLNAYFRQCWAEGQIPTVEDMCLALGTVRAVVWEWEQGKGNVSKERTYMIKKAKEILAAIDAKLVSEGKIPQVTYIFRAKNFFGMKDQAETILVPANPLGDTTDAETLRRRYLEQKEISVAEISQKGAESDPGTVPADLPDADLTRPQAGNDQVR